MFTAYWIRVYSENLCCHTSILVPRWQTAAGRGDLFRCPRWVLGSNHVHADARPCSSPFLQCHSWPLNYSQTPPQVSYFQQSTENWLQMISSRQHQYSFELHYPPCSDQTDPFNRSPLTMDQIRPNEELKQQILQWLDEHKQQRLQLGPSG